MTLVEQIEQFLYDYPVQHHKRELLDLVRLKEDYYLRKIADLEQTLALSNEYDKLVNETNKTITGLSDTRHKINQCQCLADGYLCEYCEDLRYRNGGD